MLLFKFSLSRRDRFVNDLLYQRLNIETITGFFLFCQCNIMIQWLNQVVMFYHLDRSWKYLFSDLCPSSGQPTEFG